MRPALETTYYVGWVDDVKRLLAMYQAGQRVGDQMKVVGEDDLSLEDFNRFLSSEFIDSVFMQQNAFSEVDASPSNERTALAMRLTAQVVDCDFGFTGKDQARDAFTELTAAFRDWNLAAEGTADYDTQLSIIRGRLQGANGKGSKAAA